MLLEDADGSKRLYMCESPVFQWAYDDRVRPPRHIRDAVRRYDPNLAIRWNRLLHRWDLWRFFWRSAPDLTQLTPEEITRQAAWVMRIEMEDGGWAPLDGRVLQLVYWGDMFTQFGTSPRALQRHLKAQEAATAAREKKEQRTVVNDFIHDYRKQLYQGFKYGVPSTSVTKAA